MTESIFAIVKSMNSPEILPEPQASQSAEASKAGIDNEASAQQAIEANTTNGVQAAGSGALSATAVNDAQMAVTSSVPGVQGSATGPTGSSMPMKADDLDLIEKEWVKKAKHIVEMTLGDPYKQSQEMSHVKADYLQKRFSKQLKVSK